VENGWTGSTAETSSLEVRANELVHGHLATQGGNKRPPNTRRQAPKQAAEGYITAGRTQKPYKGRPKDDEGAPRAKGATHRKSLEERIWGAFLDSPRPRPPEKELQEALAFLKKIDRSLTKKYNVVHAVDVCGGHGLVAMLLLIMGKAKKCYVLDLQFPPSAACLLKAFTAAGLLRDPADVVWVKGDVVDTLPQVLDSLSTLTVTREQRKCGVECGVADGDPSDGVGVRTEGIVGDDEGATRDISGASASVASRANVANVKPAVNAVVGIHACNYLTDVILDAAVDAAVPVALMPCCHADRTAGAMKQAAAVVGISLASVVDIARMGSLMERGFACHMFSIPSTITPVNRILLCTPPSLRSASMLYAQKIAESGTSLGGAADKTIPGTGAAERFTEKQHEALLRQSSKMLHQWPRCDRQEVQEDDKAATAGVAQGRGGNTRSRRFGEEEHRVVIQRALALQRGGRKCDEDVDGTLGSAPST
jgi:hypothetical protein